MEGYSRDLLFGIGRGESGDGHRGEQEPRFDETEVELSLGLSLGGRFGLESRGEKLGRSSSVASIVALEEVAQAPPALTRTSSLPAKAEGEAGKKQSVDDFTGCRGNGVELEPAARLPGSGCRGKGDEVEPAARLPGSGCRGKGVEVEPAARLQGSGCRGNVVEVEPAARLPGSGVHGNGVGVEPAARLPGSGSPSSGSSGGEGRRLEVNTAGVLTRTSSLPAGIENEWRKRKEAQSLRRLEVKKKRIERRSSLTFNFSKEAAERILEEMNARTNRVESTDDVSMQNAQTGGNVSYSNDKHQSSGLPPTCQATSMSQGSCFSEMPKRQNSAAKGTPNAEEHRPSSAIPPHTEGSTNFTVIATPSSSALAVRAAALGSRGEQQHISGKLEARAKSMGDVERMMMQEMPCVRTKGLPNGRRVDGFLYKYRKGEEVRIVCVCHGSFLTPAEFVKHAGGGDVANPLRHIVVNPIPPSFF